MTDKSYHQDVSTSRVVSSMNKVILSSFYGVQNSIIDCKICRFNKSCKYFKPVKTKCDNGTIKDYKDCGK